jgi:hypothetical protein
MGKQFIVPDWVFFFNWLKIRINLYFRIPESMKPDG